MPRLQPPQAFEKYMQTLSGPPPVNQAGAPAPLVPPSRTSSLSLRSACALVVKSACHAFRSRRSRRAAVGLLVVLGAIAAAGYALWYFSGDAYAQPVDAGIEDASTPTVEVFPVPFDGGAHRRTTGIEPEPLLSPLVLHLVLHDGGLVSLGLLAGLLAAWRGRRDDDGEDDDSEDALTARLLPRRLGACSIVGNTRETNQDRVYLRHVAGADVCIVADGMGGLPRGGEAAEIAVNHARERLEDELPFLLQAGMDAVRALLVAIIWETSTKLAEAVMAEGWTDNSGLRTTLILAVVTHEFHLVAWIGDGGAFLLREGGEMLALVQPHKDVAELSVLHASLGPSIEGRPAWAVTARQPGDVLIVATDGIADVFDATFAQDVQNELARAHGDAGRVAETVANAIASARDEIGHYVVTDNLTCAILVGEGQS